LEEGDAIKVKQINAFTAEATLWHAVERSAPSGGKSPKTANR
jgi:hypothetical protein